LITGNTRSITDIVATSTSNSCKHIRTWSPCSIHLSTIKTIITIQKETTCTTQCVWSICTTQPPSISWYSWT
jgi:hypothetical protein